MANYGRHIKPTQTERARPDQVVNNAGGFVFALDKWARLDRWLILGSEGGTYYASERALTKDNAQTILECLKEDGRKTVDRIQEVSVGGRAPKNDPAIFALALAAADADPATREHALAMLPRVCRIGTHLFHFARDVQNFRGWGRGLRTAVADWYLEKPLDKLTYDLLKYQSRDGWSHRDLIRLSHPKTSDLEAMAGGIKKLAKQYNASLKWAVSGESEKYTPAFLAAYEELKASNEKQAIKLIESHGFTHEMIPSELKNSPEVWEALLLHMPMTAMIRNLGKMSSLDLFKTFDAHGNAQHVMNELNDRDRLRKAKVHPLNILVAMKTYAQGHGDKGKLSWKPNQQIVDALNDAFYLAFDNIQPSGKNTLIAIDCSGSMDGSSGSWGAQFPNISGLNISPREAAAAMSMATARTEKKWAVTGFAGSLVDVPITPKMRLDRVVETLRNVPGGRTDCALPMIEAQKNRVPIDTFIIYTDNDTYAGNVHPYQALRGYRQAMGRDAKLVVVGMTATGFTIADPNDAGMMDVVGFDTAAPALISEFSKGL